MDGPRPSPPRPRPGPYVAVFAVLVATIGLVGLSTYFSQRRQFDAELRGQLTQIATLKAAQVADWRLERQGDARVAVASARLMPVVPRLLDGTADEESTSRLHDWFESIRLHYKYATALLLDAEGRIRLSAGEHLATPERYRELALEALASSGLIFHDVSGDAGVSRSHFVLGAPLTGAAGTPAGAILIAIDPSPSLLSTILTWPSSTHTGDIVIVRRDRDSALYLSSPRTNPGRGTELRDDLTSTVSPAAQAVARGGTVTDGLDRSGQRVVAAAARVADSPWTVVATMSAQEAYAPLRQLTIQLLPIGAVLVLMSAGVLGLIWRYQTSMFARQRAQADQERRALAGHYEFLTRFGNDAILLYAPDGSIVEVNDRAVEWFGYSREELLGMNARQLRDPATREALDTEWARIRREKRLVFETVAMRGDGTSFSIEVSSRVMDVGSTQYIQSIVRDISERRQAEAHIRRLNRLYAVLSECGRAIIRSHTREELFHRVVGIATDQGQFLASAIGLFATDRRLPITSARAGTAAAYLDRAPVLPDDDAAIESLHRDRPVVCNDLLGDARLAESSGDAERFGIQSSIVLPIRQGTRPIGVLALFSAERDFFNDAETRLAVEVASSVSFALDALERKTQQAAAEESLRVSRDRLERVLDAIDEGYWDWNLSTGEMHLSPRYHTMLGYVPGELRPDWDFWLALAHPEDGRIAEAAFKHFIDGRRDTFALEWRMKCKSGQYIWVLTRGKVEARDDRGVPTRLVGTHTDITDRKKLEDQFRQAQKLESVGRLAGGIAHDFNNLLTVINGYTEVVLGRLDIGDANRRHLEAVQQAGERAAGLTEQLLAFSRKQALTPRALRMNAVVRDIERLLRRLVQEDVELRLRLEAEADHVLIDPSQLNQVVMNLVVNARDAMPSGGQLTISTVERTVTTDSPNGRPVSYVVLSVADTGTGMDEEIRSHIFEPFFTTKEPGKGTGLGLATVYGIVGQSGGFIRVDSEVGSGSAFHIYLPLMATGSTQPSASPVIPGSLTGTETVLVTEDQPLVRELAVETLEGLGYTVLAASNGADALQINGQHAGPIHLLLTDVVMPCINGGDLAEQIVATRPETKVIFMSGYTDDVLATHRALRAGAPTLPKPFTPSALAAKVRDVLGAQARHDDAAGPRRTVLVVDDDESVRKLFPELLGAHYDTLLAADGTEAINLCKRHSSIDLVITDLFMPQQDGIETIQALRELHPNLPIVAISGAFGGQFLKAAERFGVDATLQKPIQRDALLRTVSQVLARSLRPA